MWQATHSLHSPEEEDVDSLAHTRFLYHLKGRTHSMANKEQKQKKEQKAAPKSNKQKKEAAREKKAAKTSKTTL